MLENNFIQNIVKKLEIEMKVHIYRVCTSHVEHNSDIWLIICQKWHAHVEISAFTYNFQNNLDIIRLCTAFWCMYTAWGTPDLNMT
jgi:hypothetical protein